MQWGNWVSNPNHPVARTILSVGLHHCCLGLCIACSSHLKEIYIPETSKVAYTEGAGGSSLFPGSWPVGSIPLYKGGIPMLHRGVHCPATSTPGDKPSLRGLRVDHLPSWCHSRRLWPSKMCMGCPPQQSIPSASPSWWDSD